MPGIINWDELWKATHAGGFHHHGRDGQDLASHWDSKARGFNKRVMKNPERATNQVATLGLLPHETVLDVGAGTGRLAIPMARIARSVTALDQSKGMLACLEENMAKEGIENIRCIHKGWEELAEGEIEPHDVVLSSNSLGVLNLRESLAKMDSMAKRAVYIFTFADRRRDDGFADFLRGGKRARHHFGGPADYLVIYNLLADMGIFADIKIMNWQSSEHYSDLDEAVAEWKEMHEIPAEREPELREFLSEKLTESEQGLCMHRHHKQAMISWQKDQPASNH